MPDPYEQSLFADLARQARSDHMPLVDPAAPVGGPGEAFGIGLSAGLKGVYSMGNAFSALGKQMLGGQEESLARSLEDMRFRDQQVDLLMQSVPEFLELLESPTVDDFVNRAALAIGQMAPSAALSLTTAGAGALAGAAAATAIPKAFLTKAIKDRLGEEVQEALRKKFAGEVLDEAESQLLETAYGAARNRAMKIGAITGAFGAELPLNTGGAAQELFDPENLGTLGSPSLGQSFGALGTGAVSSAIGVGGEALILRNLVRSATREPDLTKRRSHLRTLGRILGSGVAAGAVEGMTEATQEALQLGFREAIDPGFFDREDTDAYLRIGEAAFTGAFGGAAFGAGGRAVASIPETLATARDMASGISQKAGDARDRARERVRAPFVKAADAARGVRDKARGVRDKARGTVIDAAETVGGVWDTAAGVFQGEPTDERVPSTLEEAYAQTVELADPENPRRAAYVPPSVAKAFAESLDPAARRQALNALEEEGVVHYFRPRDSEHEVMVGRVRSGKEFGLALVERGDGEMESFQRLNLVEFMGRGARKRGNLDKFLTYRERKTPEAETEEDPVEEFREAVGDVPHETAEPFSYVAAQLRAVADPDNPKPTAYMPPETVANFLATLERANEKLGERMAASENPDPELGSKAELYNWMRLYIQAALSRPGNIETLNLGEYGRVSVVGVPTENGRGLAVVGDVGDQSIPQEQRDGREFLLQQIMKSGGDKKWLAVFLGYETTPPEEGSAIAVRVLDENGFPLHEEVVPEDKADETAAKLRNVYPHNEIVSLPPDSVLYDRADRREKDKDNDDPLFSIRRMEFAPPGQTDLTEKQVARVKNLWKEEARLRQAVLDSHPTTAYKARVELARVLEELSGIDKQAGGTGNFSWTPPHVRHPDEFEEGDRRRWMRARDAVARENPELDPDSKEFADLVWAETGRRREGAKTALRRETLQRRPQRESEAERFQALLAPGIGEHWVTEGAYDQFQELLEQEEGAREAADKAVGVDEQRSTQQALWDIRDKLRILSYMTELEAPEFGSRPRERTRRISFDRLLRDDVLVEWAEQVDPEEAAALGGDLRAIHSHPLYAQLKEKQRRGFSNELISDRLKQAFAELEAERSEGLSTEELEVFRSMRPVSTETEDPSPVTEGLADVAVNVDEELDENLYPSYGDQSEEFELSVYEPEKRQELPPPGGLLLKEFREGKRPDLAGMQDKLKTGMDPDSYPENAYRQGFGWLPGDVFRKDPKYRQTEWDTLMRDLPLSEKMEVERYRDMMSKDLADMLLDPHGVVANKAPSQVLTFSVDRGDPEVVHAEVLAEWTEQADPEEAEALQGDARAIRAHPLYAELLEKRRPELEERLLVSLMDETPWQDAKVAAFNNRIFYEKLLPALTRQVSNQRKAGKASGSGLYLVFPNGSRDQLPMRGLWPLPVYGRVLNKSLVKSYEEGLLGAEAWTDRQLAKAAGIRSVKELILHGYRLETEDGVPFDGDALAYAEEDKVLSMPFQSPKPKVAASRKKPQAPGAQSAPVEDEEQATYTVRQLLLETPDPQPVSEGESDAAIQRAVGLYPGDYENVIDHGGNLSKRLRLRQFAQAQRAYLLAVHQTADTLEKAIRARTTDADQVQTAVEGLEDLVKTLETIKLYNRPRPLNLKQVAALDYIGRAHSYEGLPWRLGFKGILQDLSSHSPPEELREPLKKEIGVEHISPEVKEIVLGFTERVRRYERRRDSLFTYHSGSMFDVGILTGDRSGRPDITRKDADIDQYANWATRYEKTAALLHSVEAEMGPEGKRWLELRKMLQRPKDQPEGFVSITDAREEMAKLEADNPETIGRWKFVNSQLHAVARNSPARTIGEYKRVFGEDMDELDADDSAYFARKFVGMVPGGRDAWRRMIQAERDIQRWEDGDLMEDQLTPEGLRVLENRYREAASRVPPMFREDVRSWDLPPQQIGTTRFPGSGKSASLESLFDQEATPDKNRKGPFDSERGAMKPKVRFIEEGGVKWGPSVKRVVSAFETLMGDGLGFNVNVWTRGQLIDRLKSESFPKDALPGLRDMLENGPRTPGIAFGTDSGGSGEAVAHIMVDTSLAAEDLLRKAGREAMGRRGMPDDLRDTILGARFKEDLPRVPESPTTGRVREKWEKSTPETRQAAKEERERRNRSAELAGSKDLLTGMVVAHELGHLLFHSAREKLYKADGQLSPIGDVLWQEYLKDRDARNIKQWNSDTDGFEEWWSDKLAAVLLRREDKQATAQPGMVTAYWNRIAALFRRWLRALDKALFGGRLERNKRFDDYAAWMFDQYAGNAQIATYGRPPEGPKSMEFGALLNQVKGSVSPKTAKKLRVQVRKAWRSGYLDGFKNVFVPSTTWLRDMGIGGRELANFFHARSRTGDMEGFQDEVVSTASRWNNKLADALGLGIGSGVSQARSPAVRSALEWAEDETFTTAQLEQEAKKGRDDAAMAVKVRKIFEDHFASMKGIPWKSKLLGMGMSPEQADKVAASHQRPNYFPRLWDMEYLRTSVVARDNAAKLIRKYVTRRRADGQLVTMSLGDARKIVANMVAKGEGLDAIDRPDEAGTTPGMPASQARMLEEVPTHELRRYGLIQDSYQAAMTYFLTAARRKAYEERGGGEAIMNALKKVPRKYHAKAESIVRGLLGQYDARHPGWLRFNSYANAVTAWTTLSMSVFSSLAEPAAAVLRAQGTVPLMEGLREAVRTMRSDENLELARQIGVVVPEVMDTLFMGVGSLDYASPKTRQGMAFFFRATGMDWILRFTRAFATGMGREFLLSAAENPDTSRNKKYLKMMGVTPEQVKTWNEKAREQGTDGLDAADRLAATAVEKAIERFVRESTVSPTYATLPALASDPRFRVLYQLKSFYYDFWMRFLSGLGREAKGRWQDGQKGGAAYMLLLTGGLMLPLAALGLEMREWLKWSIRHGADFAGIDGPAPNRAFRSDTMSMDRYLFELGDRAGLYGPFTMAVASAQALGRDQNPLIAQIPIVEFFDQTLGGDATRAIPVINNAF